jgi:hypothetical protein
MDFRHPPSTGKSVESSLRSVLTLGLDQPLQEDAFRPLRILYSDDPKDALGILAKGRVAVLLLGPCIPLPVVLAMLSYRDSDSRDEPRPTTIVICAESMPDPLRSFVNEGRIFYVARKEISPENLQSLIITGARRFAALADGNCDPFSAEGESVDYMLDLCTRLSMQTDLTSVGRLLIEAACMVLGAKVVQCFVYDSDKEIITPADASEHEKWACSAASGVVGFVARTGEPVCVDNVGLDPRYDSDIDAPVEMKNARFLAEPIVGFGGVPSGVLTALRSSEQKAFSSEEIWFIELLAEFSAPTFNQILLQKRVQTRLSRQASGVEAQSSIFRQEALDYHVRRWDQQGDVLKALPGWLHRAFWVLVVLFLTGLLALPLWWHEVRDVLRKAN